MLATLLFTALVLVVTYYVLRYYYIRHTYLKDFPVIKGDIPIFGHMFLLSKLMAENDGMQRTLDKFHQEYGKVQAIMLAEPTVIVHDLDLAIEVHNKVNKRDNMFPKVSDVLSGGTGLFGQNGEEWFNAKRLMKPSMFGFCRAC